MSFATVTRALAAFMRGAFGGAGGRATDSPPPLPPIRANAFICPPSDEPAARAGIVGVTLGDLEKIIEQRGREALVGLSSRTVSEQHDLKARTAATGGPVVYVQHNLDALFLSLVDGLRQWEARQPVGSAGHRYHIAGITGPATADDMDGVQRSVQEASSLLLVLPAYNDDSCFADVHCIWPLAAAVKGAKRIDIATDEQGERAFIRELLVFPHRPVDHVAAVSVAHPTFVSEQHKSMMAAVAEAPTFPVLNKHLADAMKQWMLAVAQAKLVAPNDAHMRVDTVALQRGIDKLGGHEGAAKWVPHGLRDAFSRATAH